MAALQGGPINTNEYERTQVEGTPLPVGLYKGIITKTEQKDTAGNSGPGIQVVVEFDITWPEEYSNRKFWDRFNVVNSNTDTVRIAKECLSDLAQAAFHKGFELNDDEELQGREVILDLGIEPAKPYVDKRGIQQAGKASNKCRKYWHVDTDIDAAKKAQKEQKSSAPVAARPVTQPQASAPAQKWGGQKPAAAPAQQPAQQAPMQQQAPQQAVAAPAGNVAPWKRAKQ